MIHSKIGIIDDYLYQNNHHSGSDRRDYSDEGSSDEGSSDEGSSDEGSSDEEFDYEEVFINKWAELEECDISDIVDELTGIIGAGQFNSRYANINGNSLYHWTCQNNCRGITGRNYDDLSYGDTGNLRVYHVGGVTPTSNLEHDGGDVYNYYAGQEDRLDPWIYETISDVENLATYLYVIKNVAVYFSQDRELFKQSMLDRENCNDQVCLWEVSPINYQDFLYVNDPEANNAIMVIPRSNNGRIPVRLTRCDNGYYDDDDYYN